LSILVVLNSRSGPPGRSVDGRDIAAAFASQGESVRIVNILDLPSDEQARRTLVANHELVVAAGGDGTISAVASIVAGTNVRLGVLALGTLNHFAKDLGIPADLHLAVATIVHGRPQSIDAAEVNGRVFVNNSSIGLYPAVVLKREGHQKLGKGKWSAFVISMLTVLGRYPLMRVTLIVGDRTLSRRTPLVFVGNNTYEIHGLKLGTRACLNDKKLCIYVTRDVGRWKLAWFAMRALFGKLREERDFDALSGTELTVATHGRSIRVATDGEVTRLTPPLKYRIRPGAITVMVPHRPAPPQSPATA